MQNLLTSTSMKRSVLIICCVLLIIAFILSVALGQTSIPFQLVYDAFFNYDASNSEHVIIRTSRFTRAVVATVVGASLAIAGALMRALTRNPLAAPDILGVNAGALFFIVCAITFFSMDSLSHYMWVAFLGAGIAGVLVFFLGSLGRDGLTPIKIVLAGAAISALFISFTQGLLVIDEQGIQSVLFWLAGSVSGRNLDMLLPVLPFIVLGGSFAFFMGRSINILQSGDDIAKGLGQRTILTKVVMGIIVILLAGGSVAVAGSIGFIGLIVPHMAMGLVGTDYRWIIPFSAVIGSTLLLLADIAARFVIMPLEMPIGVMTAFIGAPFFIYIARRGLARNA
ncbi:FecCD family ABC transporter permease [Lysinibacillus sp. 38-6]|uniref:FecCD family ABC transporter permease n=1 Tax=Lysinibacillus sp. 38-6 TaxID=3385991 RepID=UPI0039088FE0